MQQRSRARRSALVLGAMAVVAGGMAPFLEIPQLSTFLAFVTFVWLGALLSVPLADGSTLPMGAAPALGFALLGHGAPEVLYCYLAGSAGAILARALIRRPMSAQGVAARALVLAASTGAYQGFAAVDPFPTFGPHPISALGFGAIVLLFLVGGAGLRTAAKVARDRVRWAPAFLQDVQLAAPLVLAVGSVAALLALAYPALRAWALPLFLAPLAATEFSFRQLASIRNTYVQTIRALSTVPEIAGYAQPGHSVRVTQLSVGIAHEMGLSRTDEVEYAALLHDIGRISLDESLPAPRPREVATIGAAIVEETGYFPGVARAIRDQHEPYRRRGQDANRDLPLAARIIRVASTYDDLTTGAGRAPWDALERLYLDMAYEYDPRVIQALTRVLEKHREI